MSELPAAFGKYFLTDKIAVGGMAEIYLAKLIGPGGFEKRLIIKQIHPELSGQPHFVDLFVTEAKTLVSLSHGNIVPIYELGVVDDIYFIAMEYIDGPTLDTLRRRATAAGAAIAPHMALYICAEILKGLDYAHRKGEGVVHRDLSPRNVMVSREGEVKLVDFGIAVTLEDQRSEAGATGHPVGSFPYMSPEQVRREPLTAQSDLFSVGVLLWEMVTDRALFARPTPEETLAAVTDAPIAAPSTLIEGAPAGGIPPAEILPAIDRLCARALARDRRERFASAAEFLARVQRALYAREEPFTAVDLSRFVARHCPPSVHRPGSIAEPADARDGQAPTTAVHARTPAGPSTAVHPRTRPHVRTAADGARPRPPTDVQAPARGKARAPTTRSFATHIEFEQIVAKATPLFPIAALTEDMLASARARQTDAAAGAAAPAAPAGAAAPVPRRTRRGGLYGIAAAVALAAVVAAWLGLRGSPSGAAADVPGDDAGAGPVVAATDAGASVTALPAPADAAPRARSTDARAGTPPVPADARRERPVRERPDARAAPARRGILIVGANPWAYVYVDGKRMGRTPARLELPAGRHAVRLSYPAPGAERERRFDVTIDPDTPVNLGVVELLD